MKCGVECTHGGLVWYLVDAVWQCGRCEDSSIYDGGVVWYQVGAGQFCTTSPNILSVGILVGWPFKTSNVLGSIPTVAIPSPDHPPLVICLTRIIFCTKNKMYIHFNNFCIGILLGCPFKTWSTIGKVKVLFELQFNHYIYDMGGVRKWRMFGILLEFLCTLRPQCWEYKFVEIYICIEYMLPTIWVYLC